LTNEDSSVFDPYAGSGSTLLAAIINKGNVRGIEKEEKYVALTKSRIEQLYAGTLKIRPITKPIHKPSLTDKVAIIPEEWLTDFDKGAKC